MSAGINLDEAGFVEVTIGGCTQNIDALLVYSRVLKTDMEGKRPTNEEFLARVVELLVELGFPSVSHLTALRFTQEIIRVVDTLKKKELDATTQG